jgi:type 1 fimbria pilin
MTKHLSLRIVQWLCLAACLMPTAQAADTVNLHLTFNIGAPTCAFRADKLTQIVPIGQFATAEFNGDHETAPRDFELISTGCSARAQIHMTFDGTAATDPQLFATDNPALGLKLFSVDRSQEIAPNVSRDLELTPSLTGATYTFQATLKQMGVAPVLPGPVTATVNITIDYL